MWSDINFKEQTATVERALSGSVITAPKSGKTRVVPLGAPALAALRRLRKRPNFTTADDYVFATLAGDRPDPSALRRRYNAARDKSGAPALTFHGLRHTAASLFIRKMDLARSRRSWDTRASRPRSATCTRAGRRTRRQGHRRADACGDC